MSSSESPHSSGARAFTHLGLVLRFGMHLAFLDEFGHIGPYVSRGHASYNQSPVFGLSGYIIPHDKARNFATFFFQLKSWMLARELKQVAVHPATWEKKGSDLFTTKNVRKYKRLGEGFNRLVSRLIEDKAVFFYYGREKYQSPEASKASGLYNTVLSHTIRRCDRHICSRQSQFLMILDQHKDRIKLLETSAKTMFGSSPARSLIEPPFHVESHLYQTIQVADWISTVVGRAFAYRTRPHDFPEWDWADKLFSTSVERHCKHSSLWRPRHRPANQLTLPLPPP